MWISVSPRQRAETVGSNRPPRQDSSTACFCLVYTLLLLSSSLCEEVVGFCFISQIGASVFSLISHKTEEGMQILCLGRIHDFDSNT